MELWQHSFWETVPLRDGAREGLLLAQGSVEGHIKRAEVDLVVAHLLVLCCGICSLSSADHRHRRFFQNTVSNFQQTMPECAACAESGLLLS